MRLALGLLVLTFARTAHADNDEAIVQAASWGLAGLEVSGAGYVALKITKHAPEEGSGGALALNLLPAVIGAGLAVAAHHWDLDTAPALAAHGALWTGLDLMLLGALIDGHDRRDGLRFGKAAAILGAVGVVGGAVLGATFGDRAPKPWMLVPTVGLISGGVIGGIWVLASGDIGGDRTIAQLTIGAVVGLTAAIATSAVIGATTEPVEATPRVALDRDRVVLSFGGAF